LPGSLQPTFYKNLTVSGGPAPARAHFDELLPDVFEGQIEPGRVFDFIGSLDQIPDGYQAMNNRSAIKALIEL
jgi:threonine dehydrogenase-like Zn-dependent dehydrogenase